MGAHSTCTLNYQAEPFLLINYQLNIIPLVVSVSILSEVKVKGEGIRTMLHLSKLKHRQCRHDKAKALRRKQQ